MIGQILGGRYHITEFIAIGGMAEVYKARDQVLGRTVAVKVMLPQYANNPEFISRFKQEASAAANLQSPYIVNVYDWGQEDNKCFLVMEYIQGEDLKSAIEKRVTINQRKVAEIASQVCQALIVAHNQDIFHRDIKSQNIMVQQDGVAKIMDFGIARAKGDGAQEENVLGTANYLSPEQAQGLDIDGRADIYSLGCVMYEAVTGQVPFKGDTAVEVAHKQCKEQVVPPSTINQEIDPDLEAIILKAMEKDPNNRFFTAYEMKQALDCYLAGVPVNLNAMNSAATQVISPVVITPDSTSVMAPINVDDSEEKSSNPNRATTYSVDNTRKKSKKKAVLIALGVVAAIALICAGVYFLKDMDFSSTTSTVPDVVGNTQEIAEEVLENEGYVVGEITEEYSTEVEAGRVISTNPEAGTELEEGETVNLVVSLGGEPATVPDLTGMTAEEAEEAIEEAGFVAEYGGDEYSSSVEADTVSSQSPEADTEAAMGSTITYYISLGVETASIPNVVGLSQSDATSSLKSAGFKVNVETSYSDSYDSGYVISQSKTGTATAGSAITIYVSKGSQSSSGTTTTTTTYNVSDYLYEGMTVSKILSMDLPFSVSFNGDSSGTATVTGWSPTKVSEGDTVTVTTKSAETTSTEDTSTETTEESAAVPLSDE